MKKIYYKDIVQDFSHLTLEELEEQIKKDKEDAEKLTEGPPIE